MKYRAIVAFRIGMFLVIVFIVIMSPHPAFAGNYEKSQNIVQTNKCGELLVPIGYIML